MEVKPGYRQTDVGVIPEKWNVFRLDACVRRDAPICYGILMPGPHCNYGVPVVKVRDVIDGRIVESGLLLTHPNIDDAYRRSRLAAGDLLVTIRGTTGRLAVVPASLEGANITQDTARVRPSTDIDAKYLYFALCAAHLQRQIALHTIGQAVRGINIRDVKDLAVVLPDSAVEQRAIAAALSDVDALLGGLDRLIAKKRDLKQAAMQQLLTGQTRLPGFSGAWGILPARDIGVIRGGSGFPLTVQGETSGEYPFFKVSDMNNEGNETFITTANHYISEQTRKRLGATAFPAESIVFAKVGAAVFLERKKILRQPSCIDNNMAAFVLDRARVNVRYVHFLLLSKKLGDLVATTALPALNAKQLGDMQLAIPPIPEQTAIAAVLSDMDAELAALEARRNKTRDLKQAMMQELLTGKTRLV